MRLRTVTGTVTVEQLPVNYREFVPPLVLVQGGIHLVYVNGLRNPPFEPVWFLM